jgi:hypothetical protein
LWDGITVLTCPSKNKRININEGKDKNVVI